MRASRRPIPGRRRPPAADEWTEKAESILTTAGASEGYCVAWGSAAAGLFEELVRQSRLQRRRRRAGRGQGRTFRKAMVDAGLYGERVAVMHDSPDDGRLAAVPGEPDGVEDPQAAGIEWQTDFLKKAFASLRPYGGVGLFPGAGRNAGRRSTMRCARGGAVPGPQYRQAGRLAAVVARRRRCPDSANWTHEHADAANTRVSRTARQGAAGLLWFGGPSNDGVLPRHGHGPSRR